MNNKQKVRTSRMQQYIRELIQEEGLDLDSESSDEERGKDQIEQKSKRGRKQIPERWTRVISIYHDDLSNIRTFELAPELLLDASMGNISHGRGRPPEYKLLFWPPHIKKQQMSFSTAENELSDEKLRQYGQQLTQLRTQLRKQALEQAEKMQDAEENINYQHLARKMHKGYFKKPTNPLAKINFASEISTLDRRRSRRRPILKPVEKLEIVYAVIIEHQQIQQIAKKYRVSKATVYQQVQKAKKNPNFIRELYSRSDLKNANDEKIETVVNQLIEKSEFIDSTRMVVEKAKEQYSQDKSFSVTQNQVKKVMANMKMKYRKVNHIAMSANSQRSLVLRQQWAQTLLNQNPQNKTILNLDESWLGMSDFRRRKWQPPDSKNSVAAFQMTPRVTMLTAVDTKGNVYLALAQSNSNQQLMSLFWKSLCLKLDKERPGWRANTIWTLDGAAYHAGEASLELLKQLRVPVMMQGPHSYDVAPCELYFSRFKSADINPRHVPTGKSHFDAVVRLVLDRCKLIPKHTCILFWHHCLQNIFRYLVFEPL